MLDGMAKRLFESVNRALVLRREAYLTPRKKKGLAGKFPE
jgi:hypothetical protein